MFGEWNALEIHKFAVSGNGPVVNDLRKQRGRSRVCQSSERLRGEDGISGF